MRTVLWSQKLLISVFITVFVSFNSVDARKILVDKEGGAGVYTTLSSAINAATLANDTIYFQGTDVDTFAEAFPNNINNGNITFLGAETNPDRFPVLVIRDGGWDSFWNNLNNCTTRFDRVILTNCSPIILGNNLHKCIIEKSIVYGYSLNDVFTISGDKNNFLTINNSIFVNNEIIFPDIPSYNSVTGPYGTVKNCTFYGNTIINEDTGIPVATNKMIVISNSIFHQNTTITNNATIKQAYHNCLIPTTVAGWPDDCIVSNDPKFINVTPSIASDFRFFKTSPARNAGSTTAPVLDIAGNSRDTSPDIGAWEWIDTNVAPTGITLSNRSIDENNTAISLVGTFTTIDENSGDTHFYTLISGDISAFSITGKNLYTAQSFNYESDSIYSIRVRTTDKEGLHVDSTIEIEIVDVNEPITSVTLSNSTIAEKTPTGKFIGRLFSTGQDLNETFVYSLDSGDIAHFNISSDSLLTRNPLDYESDSLDTIFIRSTDNRGETRRQRFVIRITNINEPPTSLSLSNTTVSENVPLNSLVGTFSTTDPDKGSSFTYSLVSGTANFTISGDTLITKTPLDYETKNDYTIHVRSSDGSYSIVDTFSIQVINVNDPPQLIQLSDSTISDSLPIGTNVGTFSTTDQDTGDLFTYKLVSSVDSAFFDISGSSLQTASILNYRNKPSYFIRVQVTDGAGATFENDFNITILSKPIIITEPINVVGGEGKNVSFSVEVSGTMPFDYSWYDASAPGTAIGSLSTLTLNNLLMTQNNSSYYCIISNDFGETQTRPCTLVVLQKPEITTDLQDTITVTESFPCTLSIAATGDSLSYLWIKDGNDTLNETLSRLVISAALGEDGGKYRSIISNIAGTIESNESFLRVLIPPKFSNTPDSVIVLDGDTARFSLSVSGTTPLTYQWIKNGVDQIGLSAELVIPNVTLADNGSFYYCKVTNVVKTDSTAVIYLIVNPAPPEIDSQPATVSAIENLNATFKIMAHGTPELQYAWYSPGSNTVLSDSTTLVLNNVKIDQNDSKYFCVVSNIAGSINSDTVSLLVYPERPVIFTHPLSQRTNIAKRAKFTVAATGTPTMEYAWYKTGKDSVFGKNDSLVINSVKKTDEGSYYCIVTNGAGSDTSVSATLIVEDELKAPEITVQPLSQTKYIGENVTFTVTATGYPSPKYQWIRNNIPLPNDTSANLILTDLSFINDNDSIVCEVYNSEDTILSQYAVLTITPAPVADFTASPIGGKVPINVTFTNTSSGLYTSQLWDFGDGVTSTEAAPLHSYTKNGLYDVKLTVSGKAGSNTITKTKLIYAYNEGENPVQISAKYLRNSDVEITLSGLDRIEPQVFPPVYDSLGIWISKNFLPVDASTSTKLIKYSRNDLVNKATFTDTLTLPEPGITWFLMNGLYLSNRKLSLFNAGNGAEVLLRDTTPPQNVLSISGRHIRGDSALISISISSPIDTEKVDSIVFCFAPDSIGLDYEGEFANWFSVKEFDTTQFVEKIIHSDIFSMGSHQMWCGVKLKGKNDSLSTPKTAKFLTNNSTVPNPINLYAQAVSSSVIRLSWDDISSDGFSKIRIWYGTKEVPLGSTISRLDYTLIEIASTVSSYIVELLNDSTMYYFGAQVNKAGVWSDIVLSSQANVQTLAPSDDPPVLNTVSFHTPMFDSTDAKIKLTWCVDTVGIGDSLELGITYSTAGFETDNSGNIQILRVEELCDGATLKMKNIVFNATYDISIQIRKRGGKWSLPVTNNITTPGFIREPVTIFDPTVLFDTVRVFNGTIILSKDSNYGTSDTTSNTIVYYQGNSYTGMVNVGNGFNFAKKFPTPAFWIGLKYSVPAGFSASEIRIYRETSKGLFVEYESINDTVNRTISIRTNPSDYRFILLIDTMPPVLDFKNNTDQITRVGKSTTDTVSITDNIVNTKYQFCYSTGKDAVSLRIDSSLSGTIQKLILTIPKEFNSVESGIRAELRVSDGTNKIVSNMSKQVYISKVEMMILPMQWTPVSVSAELETAKPESLIIHLSEVDSNTYDNRYARVFYWYPTSSNTNAKDHWIEYNDSTKPYFSFIPGKTFWVKTRNEKKINMGPGVTMSLRDTAEISLPKKEFTDLTLPYNFAIRIKDVLDASGKDSIGIYRWTNDSGIYITKGVFIPGKANKQNRNDSLDWRYRNAYYSIYNLYNKDIKLKIPPTPVSMSSEQALKKQYERQAWGVTVSCHTSTSHLSEVYCGYSQGIRKLCYPVSPGFVSSRVKIFNRNENKFYGEYISGDLSNGGLTQEIVFENNESHSVDFNYNLTDEGVLPTNLSSSILNTHNGEWEQSGKISVAANSVEYRWFAIADKNFMERFKSTTLSWKYALSGVFANSVRNSAVFKFTVPTGANERLRFTIFDAMGRIIWEKTISQPLRSGEHTLIWNGENSKSGRVSTGMYFVKFSVLDSRGKNSKTFNSRLIYVH